MQSNIRPSYWPENGSFFVDGDLCNKHRMAASGSHVLFEVLKSHDKASTNQTWKTKETNVTHAHYQWEIQFYLHCDWLKTFETVLEREEKRCRRSR